jgi:enoyl-CoA hydratase
MSNATPMSNRYPRYTHLLLDWPAPRVLRIPLNKPQWLNAIDQPTHWELADIWRDIDADADVSSVIVVGAGRAFSAGGDLDMAHDLAVDFEKRCAGWKEARDLNPGKAKTQIQCQVTGITHANH